MPIPTAGVVRVASWTRHQLKWATICYQPSRTVTEKESQKSDDMIVFRCYGPSVSTDSTKETDTLTMDHTAIPPIGGNKGSSGTHTERLTVGSHRLSRLAAKTGDKAYRDGYVASHTRQFLARQMRAFRGEQSQKEFGKVIDKPQSVVSRLEDPNYGKWTLQSLFDVARSLDVAVLVRFVDHATFLKFTDDMTPSTARPESYRQEAVDRLASDAGSDRLR